MNRSILFFKKIKKKKLKGLRNCLTSPQNQVGIARIIPVDVHLANAPIHARHMAIGIARTRAKRNVFDVQVFAGFIKKLKFMDKTFG